MSTAEDLSLELTILRSLLGEPLNGGTAYLAWGKPCCDAHDSDCAIWCEDGVWELDYACRPERHLSGSFTDVVKKISHNGWRLWIDCQAASRAEETTMRIWCIADPDVRYTRQGNFRLFTFVELLAIVRNPAWRKRRGFPPLDGNLTEAS